MAYIGSVMLATNDNVVAKINQHGAAAALNGALIVAPSAASAALAGISINSMASCDRMVAYLTQR